MEEKKLTKYLKVAKGWCVFHFAYAIRYIKIVVPYGLKKIGARLYDFFKIATLHNTLAFLFHRYRAQQFDISNQKENIRILGIVRPIDALDCSSTGKLRILKHQREWFWFSLKNRLLFGALQARVERAVFYVFLTLTIEFTNPFDRQLLEMFLEKKLAFLLKLLRKLKRINGKYWNQAEVRYHVQLFHRNSILQGKVIEKMHKAVRRQLLVPVIEDIKQALAKGLSPLLVTEGCSGTYWMRNSKREIVGLFKPFDEEIHAPHNPIGPKYQGSLGQRRTRIGCRVGESSHAEVGAFLVDEFFGLGIVPKAHYASFTDESFFLSHEDLYAGRRARKTKLGSFMEFVEGFVSLESFIREPRMPIPLDEFQLLIILDVIIGNTDRNVGNVLIGDDKLAAVDHGLCFGDRHEDLSIWYWGYFEQGKEPFYPAIAQIITEFPFEKLKWRLKKRCFFSDKVFSRMRERIALFAAGIDAGLLPYQLEVVMVSEFLNRLDLYDALLPEKAAALIQSEEVQKAIKEVESNPYKYLERQTYRID